MKLDFLYVYCMRVMLSVTEVLPDRGVLSPIENTADYPTTTVANPAYAKVVFEKMISLRRYFPFSKKLAESLAPPI